MPDSAYAEYSGGLPEVPKWRIQSAADFVADFVAPEYIIDGVIRREMVYTLTAPTGSGKTAVMLYSAIAIADGAPGYIERGQRRLDVIEVIALAHALGVSPSRFFNSAIDGVRPEELIGNFSAPPDSRKRTRSAE
nr:AAA family ATPase [Pseudomonas sp. GX19020]